MGDDEQQLAEQLATDLEDGFTELVRVYVPAVRNFLLRLSGSATEADDLVQETFLRAYSALQDYSLDRRRALRPRAWLMTIATNIWRNHVRTAVRHPVSLIGEEDELARWPDQHVAPTEQAENALDRDVLIGALAQLPERYRMAVVLRHVVGMSYEEAAQAMGAPVGTVKAQVSRGLANLRGLVDRGMVTVWG